MNVRVTETMAWGPEWMDANGPMVPNLIYQIVNGDVYCGVFCFVLFSCMRRARSP